MKFQGYVKHVQLCITQTFVLPNIKDKRVKLKTLLFFDFISYSILHCKEIEKKNLNLVESEIQVELKIVKDGTELLRD